MTKMPCFYFHLSCATKLEYIPLLVKKIVTCCLVTNNDNILHWPVITIYNIRLQGKFCPYKAYLFGHMLPVSWGLDIKACYANLGIIRSTNWDLPYDAGHISDKIMV